METEIVDTSKEVIVEPTKSSPKSAASKTTDKDRHVSLYQKYGGWFDYKPTYDKLVDLMAYNYECTKTPIEFLEIGGYMGRSIAYIASRLKLRNVPYTCYVIDNLAFGNKELAANVAEMKAFGLNVELIVGNSDSKIQQFKDNSLSGIFIDGDHSYDGCSIDLHLSSKKIAVGGAIAGHDYGHPNLIGVRKAVEAFAIGSNREVTIIPNELTFERHFCFWFQY